MTFKESLWNSTNHAFSTFEETTSTFEETIPGWVIWTTVAVVALFTSLFVYFQSNIILSITKYRESRVKRKPAEIIGDHVFDLEKSLNRSVHKKEEHTLSDIQEEDTERAMNNYNSFNSSCTNMSYEDDSMHHQFEGDSSEDDAQTLMSVSLNESRYASRLRRGVSPTPPRGKSGAKVPISVPSLLGEGSEKEESSEREESDGSTS